MINKSDFGEGKNIEFKREVPKKHEKFLKDIIAFSNCTGGKIILGIEDNTNIVCGIGDRNPFKLSDDISNMVSDACTPQIAVDISIQTLENKTILIIDIAPGRFRPYYLKSFGKESTSYIRINGTSRPADVRKLQELEMEGQKISYDSLQDIGQEYDEKKVQELCQVMKQIALNTCKNEEEKSEIRDVTIEKLEDWGLLCKVGKNLYPTHAFMLMTDNKIRYAKIQCALFKGTTRDIFVDRKEYTGPIYGQIDDAYRFVLNYIKLGAEIDGIFRNDWYELPIDAIREMIANAVVHRSYLDDSAIQVSIYDDRIEVLSPGMLYGGMDLETAKHGKSRCRNAAIAEAFYYMHIIEAWGTGLPRIINKCKKYGLPEPKFEELGDGFKVTMFRKVSNAPEKVSNASEKVSNASEKVSNASEKVSNASEKVSNAPEKVANIIFDQYMSLLERKNVTQTFILNIRQVYEQCGIDVPFGQKNIMQWLDCSKSKATNIINEMKKAGIIEKVSGLGAGRYKFIKY